MKKVGIIFGLLLFALPGMAVVRIAGSDPYANRDLQKEFWAAIEVNDTEKVKKLIKQDKSLVLAKNSKGMSGYLRAVEKHYRSMAWLLGKNWSRINEEGPRGTALHMAVEDKDLAMVQLVLKVAQLEDDETMVSLINKPRLTVPRSAKSYSKALDTPMHIAAELCDFAIYEYLAGMGGKTDKSNGAFETPAAILATCPPPDKEKTPSDNKSANK